ncbi:hypothetical protein A2U01_0060974, partial [Trifolium medium]|nr:hypothetical protein [Trifolium medium]
DSLTLEEVPSIYKPGLGYWLVILAKYGFPCSSLPASRNETANIVDEVVISPHLLLTQIVPVLLDRMLELQREEETNKLHYCKNLGDGEESSRRTGAEKEGNVSNGFIKLPFIAP